MSRLYAKDDPFAMAKQNSTNRLGQSKALDDALGITWPDFTEREFEWTERMKKLLRAYLTKKGIHFHQTRDRLIDEAFANAKAGVFWGNKRRVISEFKRIYRQYHNERLEAQDTKQTPQVQRMLQERALNHPDQFNPDGSPRGFYETGFVPNIDAATKIANEYAERLRQQAAPASELDNWFGPKEGRKVEDELTTWSAVTAEPEGQQFAAFNHFQRELKLLDANADVTKTALAALDGVPLGLHITQHGIKATCDKLQSALDNYGTSKTPVETPKTVPPAIPTQGSTSDATEAAHASVEKTKPQEVSQMTESPVVVYPKSDGSIVYKGVKFSVTFRDGGKWDAAFPLMEEFLVHRELIARNCLEDVAQAMPSNITQMTPPAAPPVASTPATSGGGTYPVVEIKKIVDEGKTRIELFSRAGDEKAAGAVRRASDIALLVAAGVNVDALAIGTRYTVNLEAAWKDGNMNPRNNKPFRDITAIRKVG